MRTCPICGTKFKEYRSRYEKVYCSRECQMRGVEIRRAARLKVARHAARPVVTCPECGRDFLRTMANKVYCSKTCGNRASHRNAKAKALAANGGNLKPRKRDASRAKVERVKKMTASAVAEFDMLERVRAYLDLPAEERWARRGELSKKELDMARKMHAADAARF